MRTDATRGRDLAPMTCWRRDFSRFSRRHKAVGSSSRSSGMGRLFFSAHLLAHRGNGGKGGAAGSEARGGVH